MTRCITLRVCVRSLILSTRHEAWRLGFRALMEMKLTFLKKKLYFCMRFDGAKFWWNLMRGDDRPTNHERDHLNQLFY